jgi:hypothetical protein
MKIFWVIGALLSLDTGDQKKQYDADVAKSVVELQQFRTTVWGNVKTGSGKEGSAKLINLNPHTNAWHLLSVVWKGESTENSWHLENPKSGSAQIVLDSSFPTGVVIVTGKDRYRCDLFGSGNPLDRAKASGQAYSALCGGHLYLRSQAKGHQTALESATEFLRDQVAGGEKLIDVVHHMLEDRYKETGELHNAGKGSTTQSAAISNERPPVALLDPQYAKTRIGPTNLGIALAENETMAPGSWYAAAADAGIYVSIMRANLVDPKIMSSYKGQVNALDNVEAASLVYLIAFDLDRFETGYEVGTVHPRVNWSPRVPPSPTVNLQIPGPDGIGTIAPLAATGLIRPDLARKTVATFTGGYKRDHSAFKYGDYAKINHGTHYGIIENGVVFSKLQPNLATMLTMDDGSIDMRTWTEADNAMLPHIRYARQNGVPLIESRGVPGKLVGRWGPGNWAGNADQKLRSIRASLALVNSHGKRFMIYAIFSDATPSSMARVYQAYQVDYAMLTDMNALEHTYMALYRRSGPQVIVDHLLKGMSMLDQAGGQNVNRFMGFSDNRDFFYVMHKGDNR